MGICVPGPLGLWGERTGGLSGEPIWPQALSCSSKQTTTSRPLACRSNGQSLEGTSLTSIGATSASVQLWLDAGNAAGFMHRATRPCGKCWANRCGRPAMWRAPSALDGLVECSERLAAQMQRNFECKPKNGGIPPGKYAVIRRPRQAMRCVGNEGNGVPTVIVTRRGKDSAQQRVRRRRGAISRTALRKPTPQ